MYLAYQGYFRDQGIPGYSAFLAAYEAGESVLKIWCKVQLKEQSFP
ncbi:MAG: hypothetical protein CLLPBCKN_007329 [Chroococcidiopsis cubana SAG 39.79]|nr:hypothetical protein [Chroococcidiopsis cubana SAG 39.79]